MVPMAERLKVALIGGSSSPPWLDMVHIGCRDTALATLWLDLQVFFANLAPLYPITPLGRCKALVTPATALPGGKVGTSRLGTA